MLNVFKSKEIYPNYFTENDSWGPSNYNAILKSFCWPKNCNDEIERKILVQVDDKDYQGDSRVLFKSGNNYGHLQFGWGSCSGCDALQACNSHEDVDKLIQSLFKSIKWFDSKSDCLTWFKTHDWQGDYSWHAEEQQDYINKVIHYLENND